MIKDVKGYEGLYKITDNGKVYSVRRKRFIYTSIDRYGYEQCLLFINGKSKTRKIHRLVAEAFIPNPENKPQINHKNGIRNDNRINNLEWCTNSENQIHSYKFNNRIPSNGYVNKKTRSLPDKEYVLYKGNKILAEGTIKEIARKMNILPSTVKNYGNNTWKNRMKNGNNHRLLVEKKPVYFD